MLVDVLEVLADDVRVIGLRMLAQQCKEIRCGGDLAPLLVEVILQEGEEGLVSDALPVAAYDYVVDATGSPEGLRQAVAMTRPRGTLILKSTVHGNVPLDTAPVIVNEITLVGSRCGRFEPALDDVLSRFGDPVLVDCGAGKSALGFILYELFLQAAGKGRIAITTSQAPPRVLAAGRAPSTHRPLVAGHEVHES